MPQVWGVLFVCKDLTLSYLSSHISPPPPPFSFFTPSLLSLHPLTHPSSHLHEAVSLVLSLFHISKIPVPLSSFFSPLTVGLSNLFACFYPLPCPDTNFHTHKNLEECQECVCSCSVMLLLYDCNPRTWGVWVFFQCLWMDGWMEAQNDWWRCGTELTQPERPNA